MSERAKQALNGILDIFRSGQIPAAITFAAFPRFNIPSRRWSFLNRIIMMLNDTYDARGFRQWQEAGRCVKKGSKAFYIFAPRIAKEKDESGEDKIKLIGFLEVPVFRVQDTDGQPLDYEETKIKEFPFIKKAEEWGLSVRAVAGDGWCLGSYNGQEIKLATPEEMVFFHELSHHAHRLIAKDFIMGVQDWRQEIVAELSAEALCRIVGLKKNTAGNCYQYIDGYAQKAGLTPVNACLEVLADTEKVINLIMGKED
jgi:hypothetical protein